VSFLEVDEWLRLVRARFGQFELELTWSLDGEPDEKKDLAESSRLIDSRSWSTSFTKSNLRVKRERSEEMEEMLYAV